MLAACSRLADVHLEAIDAHKRRTWLDLDTVIRNAISSLSGTATRTLRITFNSHVLDHWHARDTKSSVDFIPPPLIDSLPLQAVCIALRIQHRVFMWTMKEMEDHIHELLHLWSARGILTVEHYLSEVGNTKIRTTAVPEEEEQVRL